MGDGPRIPDLVKLASDADQLVAAQHMAAKRLLDFDGEIFPKDGCAITLQFCCRKLEYQLRTLIRHWR